MIVTKREIPEITSEDVRLLTEAYEAQEREKHRLRAEQWAESDRLFKAHLHKLDVEFERNKWFIYPQQGDSYTHIEPGDYACPPQVQDALEAFEAYKGVCRYCGEKITFDTSYIAAYSAENWGIPDVCYACNDFRLSR
jgi:hypothetical protein